jgi:hypothetical protein
VFFSDDLEARRPDDPLNRFVLIPGELLEFPSPAATLDPERAASEPGVPVGELRAELGPGGTQIAHLPPTSVSDRGQHSAGRKAETSFERTAASADHLCP